MVGRSFSSNTYRYGFNGKENDDEVKNITGSQQDYGMRIYDPRLGKFLSVDPLTRLYSMLTPYQFASNTPIQAIDLDGMEAFYIKFRTFIPQPLIKVPSGSPSPFTYHKGDDRMEYQTSPKSFRTEHWAYIDFQKDINEKGLSASPSYGYDENKKLIGQSLVSTNAGSVDITYGREGWIGTDKNTRNIHFTVNATNKLEFAYNPVTPSIDANVYLKLTYKDDGSFDYEINIPNMDGFPAYELWIQDAVNNKSYLLFSQNPIESGETPWSLFGEGEHSYWNLKGNSKNQVSGEKFTFEERPNIPDGDCSDEQ